VKSPDKSSENGLVSVTVTARRPLKAFAVLVHLVERHGQLLNQGGIAGRRVGRRRASPGRGKIRVEKTRRETRSAASMTGSLKALTRRTYKKPGRCSTC
jgi:hypothetical protein